MDYGWYKYFNYGSIVFVAILLILILTDLIPRSLYTPILILTVIIFILRIVARMYFSSKSKSKNQEG